MKQPHTKDLKMEILMSLYNWWEKSTRIEQINLVFLLDSISTELDKEKWQQLLGPEHTGHFVQPHVAAHCGGDIYSRRKPLFSSFGEHTAVCGSSVRQAVARPRHRQSVCIHNIHVAATCRPSVLGSATMRGHMWLNKVASVLGPLLQMASFSQPEQLPYLFHCTMGSKITNQSSWAKLTHSRYLLFHKNFWVFLQCGLIIGKSCIQYNLILIACTCGHRW